MTCDTELQLTRVRLCNKFEYMFTRILNYLLKINLIQKTSEPQFSTNPDNQSLSCQIHSQEIECTDEPIRKNADRSTYMDREESTDKSNSCSHYGLFLSSYEMQNLFCHV